MQKTFGVVGSSVTDKGSCKLQTTSQLRADGSFSPRPGQEEPNRASQELETRRAEDAEISIFDARRYFSENSEQQRMVMIKRVSPMMNKDAVDQSSTPRLSSVSSLDDYGTSYRARSFHATPTASSEASWNSQTGLLSNPPGTVSVCLRNPEIGRETQKNSKSSPRWRFGRKCPCMDKKSVQVEETAVRLNNKSKQAVLVSSQKQSRKLWKNSQQRATNNKPGESAAVLRREWEAKTREAASSDSHRYSTEKSFLTNSLCLGQRVTTSGKPLGVQVTGFTFPILKPSSSVSPNNKQVMSNSPPPTNATPSTSACLQDRPRDSLEVFQPPMSSQIPEPRRERQSFTFPAIPAAATADEGDDLGSDASSDLFEIESFSAQNTPNPTFHSRRDSLEEARRSAAGGGPSRRSLGEQPTTLAPSEATVEDSVSDADDGGGLLLGCRCEKALSVGPKAVRCVAEGQAMGATLTQRSASEHVSGRPAPANKPPLGRSRSATLSLPFATQTLP